MSFPDSQFCAADCSLCAVHVPHYLNHFSFYVVFFFFLIKCPITLTKLIIFKFHVLFDLIKVPVSPSPLR